MKKFNLLFLLLMLAISIHAQELTEQEVQAKEDSIFNIKFKEQSHYAETVIDMITEDDAKVSAARQQSMLLLQTHIIEIFSKRFKMSHQDVREIWDVIEDKCQNVEVKRGTLWRVFTYMAKDAFKSFIGGKIENLNEEDTELFYGPKVPDELPPLPENSGIYIPNIVIDTIPTPSVTIPSPNITIPNLCQKMLDKENKDVLIEFLEESALYNELFFGSSDEMQYLDKCYVIIIDKESNKIKAILDKGESTRYNFITKGMDYSSKYNNEQYEIIYVQEL